MNALFQSVWFVAASAAFTCIAGICVGFWFRGYDCNRHERHKNLRRYIQSLRDQVPGNSGIVDHILGWIARDDLIPEDFGTTELELRDLAKRLRHKESAQSALNSLRVNCPQIQELIKILNDGVRDANCTLEDIGTNQAEIDAFPKKIATVLARDLWQTASSSLATARLYLRVGRRACAETQNWMRSGSLDYKDIGCDGQVFYDTSSKLGMLANA